MNSTASVPMPCPAMSSFSLLLIAILVAPNLSLKLGEHCNFVDLCSLGATEDSTCAPGQKFLLRGKRGVRRQFLVTNSSSLVMFLTKGEKVTDCNQLSDISSRISCKVVPGLSELVLARGSEGLKTRRAIGEDRAIKGRHCEFIRLCNLPQCQNGQKFLVQGEQGVRRQFLLTNEGNIVIFLTRGRKARDCSGPGWSILVDITPSLVCKTVPGAAQLQLLGVEQELEEEQQLAPTLPPSAPVVCLPSTI